MLLSGTKKSILALAILASSSSQSFVSAGKGFFKHSSDVQSNSNAYTTLGTNNNNNGKGSNNVGGLSNNNNNGNNNGNNNNNNGSNNNNNNHNGNNNNGNKGNSTATDSPVASPVTNPTNMPTLAPTAPAGVVTATPTNAPQDAANPTAAPTIASDESELTTGVVTEITSFSVPRSPSGMYFDEDGSSLLYVLCGTNTNGDHYLYAYTTDGEQQCLMTIPQSVGMSRVDGFYISQADSKAYIVDSQGPIYADEGDDYLGGSLYEVDWTNPCGCDAGSCTESSVTWTPTVTDSWSLLAADVSSSEGGGVDAYFRNSGVVIVGDTWFGVNGVHPVDGTLTSEYPKSIVQVDMATDSVIEVWSFDATTLGHDVDMEGLTCGPDECTSYLYIGDEYNYIYKLNLSSGEVEEEWDLGSIVGNVPADKGIEALTYASTTGYFYAGIQETAEIHVVDLA